MMAKAPAKSAKKNAKTATRTVLVSGGSRGLGLGIARKLVAAGYDVIAIARSENKELAAAIAEAKRAKHGALHFVPFDLGEITKIPVLVRDLRKQFGPLFGLINNAAVGRDGALSLMHNSQIEEVVRLNTLSPIVLTKYVVRAMMSDGDGRIVNVASIIGFTGYSGLSVYGATKASMLGFTRSLAREVGRLGITVNAIAPGFLDTDMTHGLAGAQREQVVRRSALRRLAGVDDVADAVEYLLSDKARSISGTVLTIDAGATA
jgi:3-oxoacyl-[acyl-carrier protein] reductase